MMRTHIIHDDNIPFVQCGNERVLEIVQKFFAGCSTAVNRIGRLPDLVAEPYSARGQGKYGLLRLQDLKECRSIVWTELVMEGKLYPHLLETGDVAQDLLDSMMPGMAKEAGVYRGL